MVGKNGIFGVVYCLFPFSLFVTEGPSDGDTKPAIVRTFDWNLEKDAVGDMILNVKALHRR